MSTARAGTALLLALAALEIPRPAAWAHPPIAAAARELPPEHQRALFGALPPPVYALEGDRTLRWGAVAVGEFDRWAANARGGLGCCLLPHLDESRRAIGVPQSSRADGTPLTGRGVVVGVVDSGFDLAHADLRERDGATRVAWFLDYTRAPAGRHAALEARYGIDVDGRRVGAVFDSADLQSMLANGSAPDDPVGHGTLVTSITAGNGGGDARYVGVAPAATLVLVRASLRRDRAAIPEATAVAGTAFIFERAAAMRSPAVVTLSVGTHRGAHDGDSPLERALASFERPGRAVVVSAGNDGQRALHARAYVLSGAATAVPFRVSAAPAGGPGDVLGIEVAYTAGVSVALRGADGRETPWVAPGEARVFAHPDGNGALVSIANATDGASPATGVRVADVLLASGGDTRAPRPAGVYALLLRGAGRVDAWFFQSGTTQERPVFLPPYGDTRVTVTIPATSPALIAVGAVSTRTRWSDRDGLPVSRADVTVGTAAPWSARGPDFFGRLKPDLVAPGDVVLAALSSSARDDMTSPLSDRRLVQQDGAHVVATGTSAAAPHVAGAVALLLEEFPSLTSREALAALAGGAVSPPASDSPRWNASEGWGMVRVDRALAVLRQGAAGEADARRSNCTLDRRTLAVDEAIEVPCRVVDASGMPAYAAVSLDASGGTMGEARYEGGGRYVVRYIARGLRVGERVRLTPTLNGAPVATWTVTITRDPALGNEYETAGGCHAQRGATWRGAWWVALIALARLAQREGTAPTGSRPGRGAR